MNTEFHSVVHALGAFFNVCINDNCDHVFFEIEKNAKVLVTLINDDSTLLLNITLGIVPECLPKDVLLEFVSGNEELSKISGPRFSYLEKNRAFAIMDVISESADARSICYLIDALITVACEIKSSINDLGYHLLLESQ